MKLLTKAAEQKLIQNHLLNEGGQHDFKPVVKLFGGGACTWLLTEYSPDEDLFFGLCDLGVGFPEIGYVSRSELEEVRFPPFGLPIERDLHFVASKTLSQYADEAKQKGRIHA